MRTSDLVGAALDWVVAKCEGYETLMHRGELNTLFTDNGWKPSTNWAQGGPIIERERIDCISDPNGSAGWLGRNYVNQKIIALYGSTPLIAAMRCYVASKLGDEIEIPEGLK